MMLSQLKLDDSQPASQTLTFIVTGIKNKMSSSPSFNQFNLEKVIKLKFNLKLNWVKTGAKHKGIIF
jgi:hypothetical protein